jgi:hypothetical protein
MFIKRSTYNTNQWLDTSAGIEYKQRCRVRWLQSIRPPDSPISDHVIKYKLFKIIVQKLRMVNFQGYGNIYTFAERKSGFRHIGHAFGFYERWTSVWARRNRCNWIRLYILCPYIGKI